MYKIFQNVSKAVVSIAVGIAGFAIFTAPALALSADQAALVAVANQYVTDSPGTNQAYVDGMSIYGNWALVGWTDNTNAAGQFVASKASGSWVKTVGGGGQFTQSELQSFAGIDATSAAFLMANFRPLPPASGTIIDISGSSTYDYQTYKCTVGYGTATSGDNGLSFVTDSYAPTDPAHAVTIDVTTASTSFGSAVVTLFGPGYVQMAQTTVDPGYTGGVGYWHPNAASGYYTYTITGTTAAMDSPCSGSLYRAGTRTDATWTGVMGW